MASMLNLIGNQMQQFDEIDAAFRPRDLNTLKAEAHALIGRRAAFKAMWMIEEGQQYFGEWAMEVPIEWMKETGVAWVPSGDLVP